MDSEYYLFIPVTESKTPQSNIDKWVKCQCIQDKSKKQIFKCSPYYTNKHSEYLAFCHFCEQVFQMQSTIYEEEKDKNLFAREYLYDKAQGAWYCEEEDREHYDIT